MNFIYSSSELSLTLLGGLKLLKASFIPEMALTGLSGTKCNTEINFTSWLARFNPGLAEIGL